MKHQITIHKTIATITRHVKLFIIHVVLLLPPRRPQSVTSEGAKKSVNSVSVNCVSKLILLRRPDRPQVFRSVTYI